MPQQAFYGFYKVSIHSCTGYVFSFKAKIELQTLSLLFNLTKSRQYRCSPLKPKNLDSHVHASMTFSVERPSVFPDARGVALRSQVD